jgi:hypothetical protein
MIGTFGVKRAAAVKFVGDLLDNGMLELVPPTDDTFAAPLRALARWIDAAGYEKLDENLTAIRSALLQAQHALEGLATAHAPERQVSLRTAAASALNAIATRVGLPSGVASAGGRPPIVEDVVIRERAVALDRSHWKQALSDLDTVRRLMALFDPKLPFRRALAAFFRVNFPGQEAVPLLSLFRTYYEQIRSSGDLRSVEQLRIHLSPAQRASSHLGVGVIDDILSCRAAFVRDVCALETEPGAPISIPQSLIARHAGSWPSYLRAPRSVGFDVQILDPQAGTLVVNGIRGGHGRGHARTRRLILGERRLVGDPPACQCDNAILAELDHPFGNTVNVRAQCAPYAIGYPGSFPDRPDGRVIPYGELDVIDDSAQSALRLRRRGTQELVKPVYTAAVWDVLLPAPVRFLLDGFADPPAFAPSHAWWLNAAITELPAQVRRYPRIDLGSITLRRSFWAVDARQIPAIEPGETDALYMLRLAEWLHDNDMPERSYVRLMSQTAPASRDRKPMLLDIGNWYTVMGFHQRLASAHIAFFTEELPRHGDAPAVNGARRAVELLLEVSGPAE